MNEINIETIKEKNYKGGSKEALIKLEEEIDTRIKMLPRALSNLKYIEKRKIIINQINKNSNGRIIKESLDLPNNKIKLFNLGNIRKNRQEFLENEISKIKDTNKTPYEKKLIVLNQLNSSETYEYEEKKEDDINNQQNILNVSGDYSIPNQSTIDVTLSVTDSSTMDISQSQIYLKNEDPKIQSWIKNQYYDIIEKSEIKGKIEPKKLSFKDNKNEYIAFLYDDNLTTYNFTVSKYFGDYKILTKEKKDDKFKKEYGLIFCNKKIDKYKKNCKPDEMICDECMEKNLKLYNLNKEEHALINIKGRVSFNNLEDKKFHCLGKFSVDKDIYLCSTNFSCKACNILDEMKSYYNKK